MSKGAVMATTHTAAPPLVAMPDLRAMLGAWDALSSQVSGQSTVLSRDAVSTGLRLFEQAAANADECLRAWGSGARRVGELARAAEHRIGAAEDAAGVWNLEFDLLAQAAQMAAAFAQDSWLTLARTQAALLQAAVGQGEQAFERALRTINGASSSTEAPTADQAAVPLLPFLPAPEQWSALAETMSENAQAWWSAAAASSAAAMQRAAAEPVTAPTAPPAAHTKRRRSR
jgi:hypothetical protein